jgi:hypothetical protein
MCRSRSLAVTRHDNIDPVSHESPPEGSAQYDQLPGWTAAALDESPDETFIDRLATRLSAALGLAYPAADFQVSGGADNVTVVWGGGPTVLGVLSAVELEWAFEDRGAWIATVDNADPGVWPTDEIVSFVFRRRAA